MVLNFDQFKQLLDDTSITLIDTRLPSQWMDGHIPNALHISHGYCEIRSSHGRD
jgi:rhodanese-related sulfurtransferase